MLRLPSTDIVAVSCISIPISTAAARVLRMSLKFKGDKVKKKKRSHKEIDDIEDKGEGSSTDGSLVKSARQRYGKDPQG